ncbi:hypothetical protein ACB092_10G052200 [Castanea dentata]
MADRLYFLVYANTDLEGRSNRGLAKTIAPSPSGGIRENPRLLNNSFSNEVITVCQYPCMVAIQTPSLCEPRIVTAVKRLLQNSKAVCRRNGRIKVGDSIREERLSRIS